jgi:hypothetical protein
MDITLAVEDVPLISAALSAPTVLVANANTRVDIDARTSLPAVVAVLERTAGLPRFRYEMTGAAVLDGGVRLPFRRTGELPAFDLAGGRR